MYVSKEGEALWSKPSFFPKEDDGKHVFVMEEMNTAPKSVQAVTYQFILDKRIGDYAVDPGNYIIACGNLETDNAVATRMSTALANRFMHISMDVDLEDWVAWALQNGIRTDVVAFIRFRPGLLHNFDPKSSEKAFASPRSWEFLSKAMDSGLDKELEYEACGGTVGEGAASEYLGFLKIYRNLPNRDVILQDPEKAPVPDDPATQYAICGALSAVASEQTFPNITKYAHRLPTEFSVLLIKDSIKVNPELTNTRVFMDWATKNSDVLI
jgi:hypothetical protein